MEDERRQEIEAELRILKSSLSESSSPIGDWKNIKQLDTNEYTEEEMTEYRAARAEVRAKINELTDELSNL